ncbi:NAD(P)(+)--arginine ADP-ribosyltransferase 1-like [Sardina pilchardus]|uniref:NAD(P)(+)--arginine ADP-ribosyltransferase 1-like n=1 Tax=Sardina pilchardus TaxID=27697 RepID=UPI002E11C29D
MMTFAALVLIFLTPGVALGQHGDRTASIKVLPLDMAENSVDDQYDGCQEEMTSLIQITYLKQELMNISTNFNNAWKKGTDFCSSKHQKFTSDNLTWNHCIALHAYTLDKNTPAKIFDVFNNATRAGRPNYINRTYGWYSLHFFLTVALQRLKAGQMFCKLTYRGTNSKFEIRNTEIRLNTFTSSSINRAVAQEFGKVSCFKIKTCHGVSIQDYSRFPNEGEVLIPPYETFKVTAVKKKSANPSLWCETVYELYSTGTRSNQQCELVKLEASGESQIYNRYQPLVVSSAYIFTLIHTFLR